jgi:fructose 1,6-bisphosphatase
MIEGQFGDFMDHLGDASFNHTRQFALQIADYMQRHGSFEPGILPDEDLVYGGRPKIIAQLQDRFGTPAEIRDAVLRLRQAA